MSSKESLLTLLKTLCEYNNVSITHEFNEENRPLMTVRCLSNTNVIEITYHSTQAVRLFNNFESAIKSIQQVISEHSPKNVL
jgi:hypothetical protein